MGYQIPKFNVQLPQFGVLARGFTEDEVEKITFLEKLIEFDKGLVGFNKGEPNTEARNSDVSFLVPDENTHWVFQRLSETTSRVNYDLFMYNIEGIETIQYTIYSEDEEQFYDWHMDTQLAWTKYTRKISGVVMLSDPDEYEGGELEIINTGHPERSQVLKPPKGDIAFFASWMPHRVRPVTKGVRRTLVFWVEGPNTL